MKPASAATVSEYLDSHEYPTIFYKYAWLIRLLQWVNMAVTLRNWYVWRRFREVANRMQGSFSMLDAGCGLGDFALLCAKNYPDSAVVGVDVSESSVNLARQVSETLKLKNIMFMEEDLPRYHSKQQFDLILCNAVLQSVQEDEGVLHNLAAALNRGGKILLYTPVRYKRYIPFFDKLEDKYLDRFFYRYGNGFSHHRYSADDVVRKVQGCGLNIERLELAYGFCGGIAFELYSLFLILVKTLPSWVLFVIIPLYVALVFPFQLFLMLVDYSLTRNEGNGLLVLAKKT